MKELKGDLKNGVAHLRNNMINVRSDTFFSESQIASNTARRFPSGT